MGHLYRVPGRKRATHREGERTFLHVSRSRVHKKRRGLQMNRRQYPSNRTTDLYYIKTKLSYSKANPSNRTTKL